MNNAKLFRLEPVKGDGADAHHDKNQFVIRNVFKTIDPKTQFQIQVLNSISGESLGTGGFYLFENLEVIRPVKEFWFPIRLASNSRKAKLIDQIGYIHFYVPHPSNPSSSSNRRNPTPPRSPATKKSSATTS